MVSQGGAAGKCFGSIFNLGDMYALGEGVPEDDAQAVSWYRKAAEQGFAEAQYNLGVMYVNGTGVPEDDAQAVSWYRKAAEQGHAKAQYNLGAMYVLGMTILETSKWLSSAAIVADNKRLL